uniref:Expansin family protein n=1 Tax=Flammulina velutipes TaxID=38945 RepID=D2JY94_FLAVE|nr:expansin family protein [Flammulina velutipes]
MLFRNIILALTCTATAFATSSHVVRGGRHMQRHSNLSRADPVAPVQRRASSNRRRDLTRRQCRQRESTTTSSSIAAEPTVAAAEVFTPEVVAEVPTTSAEPTTEAAPTQEAYTPAPETTTAEAAPAETYSPPAADTGSSSGSGESFTGQVTYYATGLGACGITNNDNQPIAAVSKLLFDSYPGYDGVNPNNNPMCGKYINLHYGGNTVSIQAVDRCEGCAFYDLDLSPSSFEQLASFSLGRLSGATWEWA